MLGWPLGRERSSAVLNRGRGPGCRLALCMSVFLGPLGPGWNSSGRCVIVADLVQSPSVKRGSFPFWPGKLSLGLAKAGRGPRSSRSEPVG